MSVSRQTDDKSVQSQQTKKKSSIWRNRDYLLLWSGQSISDIGSSISTLAFPLLVLYLTHSPAQAGFVGAANALPRVVVTLLAGVLVDRWDRKRLMLCCDIGRAISLASIPIAASFDHLTMMQLYIAALIEGTLVVFSDLAETTCLPQVVSAEQLSAAVAQTEVTEGTTTLFGPPLSGLLFTISAMLPFLADAISYTVSIFTLLLIRTPFQQDRHKNERKLHTEIIEGFVWLWHQPFIRNMTLLSGFSALALPGTGLIIIVLAQQQHATSAIIGLIFAADGLGAILGSLLASRLQKRITVGQSIILCRWIFAILMPLYAIAPNSLALAAIGFGIGVADPIEDVPYFSHRLALIPDALKGRVISVCRLFSGTVRPLGLALTGILIQQFGPIRAILVLSLLWAIITLVMTLDPHIRKAK
jgi:MFS family permease